MRFKEYVDWKWRQFNQYVLTPPKSRNGNGKRIAYRFTTQSLPVFTEYHSWFYRERKKHVPKDIILTPLTLAVWFMDDGTKSRSACYLNTQQFDFEDQKRLQNLLFTCLGLQSTLNRDKHYYRIRITSEATRILHDLIRPHILPCFQYKFMNDPVTTDPKGEALAVHC